jgi:hypothetical protein
MVSKALSNVWKWILQGLKKDSSLSIGHMEANVESSVMA